LELPAIEVNSRCCIINIAETGSLGTHQPRGFAMIAPQGSLAAGMQRDRAMKTFTVAMAAAMMTLRPAEPAKKSK